MRRPNLTERPTSRDLLASWYAAALEEQVTSGLSMAEFADELGVSAATLYQWRRRLANSDDRSVIADNSEPELIEVLLGNPQRGPSRRSSMCFTVQLTNSRSIDVPSDFDADTLQRVVRALESC